MKRLAVLRHAKSSWDNPAIDDSSRPLNRRGRDAAHRMAQEIARRGLSFDTILASPAVRVRETLAVLDEHLHFSSHIRFEPMVYLADEGTLVRLLRSLADPAEGVLLVGHNPGLQRLILQLSLGDASSFQNRVARGFPTAALALLDLRVEHWADISPGVGKILDLVIPKELD